MTENLPKILEASYKPQREAEADLEQLGYKYDPELSSMDTKVFYDPHTKQPHIAYRGSIRASDWLDNINLAIGGKSKQKDEAIAAAHKVKEKYGQAPTTYGHSRGAHFAEVAGEATGGSTYTYNKATLPKDILKNVRNEQTDIRTSNDIVSKPSIFQTGGKKITIQSPLAENFISAHGLGGLNSKKSFLRNIYDKAKGFRWH